MKINSQSPAEFSGYTSFKDIQRKHKSIDYLTPEIEFKNYPTQILETQKFLIIFFLNVETFCFLVPATSFFYEVKNNLLDIPPPPFHPSTRSPVYSLVWPLIRRGYHPSFHIKSPCQSAKQPINII